MRVYKLYASFTSSTNAAAAITIAKTGKIRHVKWSASFDGVTDNGKASVELSFFPTSFIATNDSAGPIDQIAEQTNFNTSGLNFAAVNQQTVDLDVAVGMGEKLYLNSVCSGTIGADVTCFVYVQD